MDSRLSLAATTLIVASWVLAVPAISQTAWPNKPVRLIVPFPAGSTTDVVARVVAQKLSERLGQQVVVDNRGGASGNIGMVAVARAEPDGYTIGLATISTHAIAPAMSQNLPYDPIKDFTAISMIGATPYVLTVYPGLPVKSVNELTALAKSKPGKLTFASSGPATLAHLALAYLANLAGVKMTHVAYKGSNQSLIDIIAGRVDMQLGAIPTVAAFIRSGELKAIAVTSAERTPLLPEIPTISESGVAGYEASLWMALIGPPNLPDAITVRINRELNTMLRSPEMAQTMSVQGMVSEPGSAEALRNQIQSDIKKWRKVIEGVAIEH